MISLTFLLVACQSPTPESQPDDRTPPEPTVIRVSAIPDENPTDLIRKYAPLVAHLEKALGTKVVYTPATDYGAVVQALAAGKVDFAWLGAFTFVQSKRFAGAVPLCMRRIDRKFKSGFVVHKDSGITTMEELKGKRFAFGSKSSTSGHLMPRHFMSTMFKIDSTKDFRGAPLYSGSHDATVKMVESGKVDAGAANLMVIKRLLKNKKIDPQLVKLMWTTPPYVDYVWAARSTVSAKMREKFKAAFLSLDANQPSDKKVLDLQGAKGFVEAKIEDFDAVEQVGLDTGLLKGP
jgi:phosphonate transport system substrate-binding protein